MSNLIARRQPRWLPDLSELFTDFPMWADRPLIVDTQLMRLEAGMQDGHYVVGAEIPGIDPVIDVDIIVRDSQLTIKAERNREEGSQGPLGVSLRLFCPLGDVARRRQRRGHQGHLRQRHPDRLGRRSPTGRAGRETCRGADGELILSKPLPMTGSLYNAMSLLTKAIRSQMLRPTLELPPVAT